MKKQLQIIRLMLAYLAAAAVLFYLIIRLLLLLAAPENYSIHIRTGLDIRQPVLTVQETKGEER